MQTQVAWKSRLRIWGYVPVFCSLETKFGLDTLAFILRDQTTVIVGPSGVGKSSLINALRSKHPLTDVSSEGNNWFDSVGLCSLLVYFQDGFFSYLFRTYMSKCVYVNILM